MRHTSIQIYSRRHKASLSWLSFDSTSLVPALNHAYVRAYSQPFHSALGRPLPSSRSAGFMWPTFTVLGGFYETFFSTFKTFLANFFYERAFWMSATAPLRHRTAKYVPILAPRTLKKDFQNCVYARV